MYSSGQFDDHRALRIVKKPLSYCLSKLFLVSVFSQAFLTFMSSDLVTLPFFTAWHSLLLSLISFLFHKFFHFTGWFEHWLFAGRYLHLIAGSGISSGSRRPFDTVKGAEFSDFQWIVFPHGIFHTFKKTLDNRTNIRFCQTSLRCYPRNDVSFRHA